MQNRTPLLSIQQALSCCALSLCATEKCISLTHLSVFALGQVAAKSPLNCSDEKRLKNTNMYVPAEERRSQTRTRCVQLQQLHPTSPPASARSQLGGWRDGGVGGWMWGGRVRENVPLCLRPEGTPVCEISLMCVSSAAEAALSLGLSAPHRPAALPGSSSTGCSSSRLLLSSLITGVHTPGADTPSLPPSIHLSLSLFLHRPQPLFCPAPPLRAASMQRNKHTLSTASD